MSHLPTLPSIIFFKSRMIFKRAYIAYIAAGDFMAIKLEIYINAQVQMSNGNTQSYDAIYPTFNGLVTGKIMKQENVFTQSHRRRFGRAKPVKEQLISYFIFNDTGFLRDGTYTFFTGEKTHAFTQKLTNDEIRDQLLFSNL